MSETRKPATQSLLEIGTLVLFRVVDTHTELLIRDAQYQRGSDQLRTVLLQNPNHHGADQKLREVTRILLLRQS